MKTRPNNEAQSGFVLPAVVIIMLLLVLFGFGRMAAFRYQSERRIDLQRQTEARMAARSGISYLLLRLTNSTYVGPDTVWVTDTVGFRTQGDGHRFEVVTVRKVAGATSDVARADLTIYDTGNPTSNLVVNAVFGTE